MFSAVMEPTSVSEDPVVHQEVAPADVADADVVCDIPVVPSGSEQELRDAIMAVEHSRKFRRRDGAEKLTNRHELARLLALLEEYLAS